MNPTISVLLPVYNGQAYLKQAIDSILNQSYQDFELVIVNDGSSDGSLELINSYADKRIVLINQDNAGLPGALNRAINEAKGQYLARHDQDDVSLPTRFEKQLRLMEAQDLDFCGCNIVMMEGSGKLMQEINMPTTPDLITITMACTVPFAHGSVMIRKSFLDQHALRYRQGSSTEDYELWCEAYRLGAHFGNVNKVLFHYRDFSSSLSKISAKKMQENTHRLRRHFVRMNAPAVQEAIDHLLPVQKQLETRFEGFLLLAAYLLNRQNHSKVFLKVLQGTSIKNIVIAAAKLLRGF
jgi:glycosyltransferase involved in cell wall biosynthesis